MTSIESPYKINIKNKKILFILKLDAYAKNVITVNARKWSNLSWIKNFVIDESKEIKLIIEVNKIVKKNINLTK